MSFLGKMFGGNGNGCEEDAKNCECNKMLKDHLKKCAGLGERPPLIESCAAAKELDPCKLNDLSGPPTCKGKTCAPTQCCPPAPPKIVVFVPKCTVPPTATFKCPADCCTPQPPKVKCCPKPEPPKCCNDSKAKCPEVYSQDGQKLSKGPCAGSGGGCVAPKKTSGGACGSGNGSGSENSCEPRPLYMDSKKC